MGKSGAFLKMLYYSILMLDLFTALDVAYSHLNRGNSAGQDLGSILQQNVSCLDFKYYLDFK